MSSTLLAPFDNSMKLGQGYNSFLQTPCILGAVEVTSASADRGQGNTAIPAQTQEVSQSVSYSARFVERFSDILRSMNVSSASSVKSGTVDIGNNSLNLDNSTFSTSDLTAVISVKVQTFILSFAYEI
ncbi:hypothetical protein TWF694_006080 [Orbilia ellipsospora]|uniref:Uncharacterized protein n=1 Tax=Orbilia ellipsospora TaxID=2528407 RepID=A0AAV9WX87_9PEZI